ncbi:hypothetical protein D3C71_1770630 [compost metagenome]
MGIAQQHLITIVLLGRQLNFAHQRCEAGVDDGRYQQAQHFDLPGFKLLRGAVWLVLQRRHRQFNTGQRILAHLIDSAVQHVGYRTDRHPGMTCHITYIRHHIPVLH